MTNNDQFSLTIVVSRYVMCGAELFLICPAPTAVSGKLFDMETLKIL